MRGTGICVAIPGKEIREIDDIELLGAYCYIATFPDGYEVTRETFIIHFKLDGQRADYLLNTLWNLGYIKSVFFKNDVILI